MNAPTLPPIGSPPLWETLILTSPAYGAILALIAGAVGAYLLRSAGRPKPALGVLGGGVALAAAIVAAGMLIETPREAAVTRTKAFVNAVVQGEDGAIDRLMSERMQLAAGGELVGSIDRDTFVRVVENTDEAITSNRLSIDGAEARGSLITVRFTAQTGVTQSGAGIPVRSTWEMDWARGTSGEWRAMRLDSLWIRGMSDDAWVKWAQGLLRR